ncbi:hypothetical protein CEXT_426471 [Caerostris extrusa]|uniref:Uncharacterized protein n=1 Tax=Caerostris extrusa TaxID=172846 RepID=A0AAV4Y209_CAEEX|nr:hypothetical protein CEXT_426471 [Caerostris extrusa]
MLTHYLRCQWDAEECALFRPRNRVSGRDRKSMGFFERWPLALPFLWMFETKQLRFLGCCFSQRGTVTWSMNPLTTCVHHFEGF